MTDRLIYPWVLTHCWLQTCVYQTSKFSNEEVGSSTLSRALHPLVHITSWPKPPFTCILVCGLLLSEAVFWICLHVGAVWLTSGSLMSSSLFSDPQGSSVLNFKIVSNHRPWAKKQSTQGNSPPLPTWPSRGSHSVSWKTATGSEFFENCGLDCGWDCQPLLIRTTMLGFRWNFCLPNST